MGIRNRRIVRVTHLFDSFSNGCQPFCTWPFSQAPISLLLLSELLLFTTPVYNTATSCAWQYNVMHSCIRLSFKCTELFDLSYPSCVHDPCFRMSLTVLATPLSGSQLMLMEYKLLNWQQMQSSPSITLAAQWLCPYIWSNHCQRTWPSTTLSPPTGVTKQETLSLIYGNMGDICCVWWAGID